MLFYLTQAITWWSLHIMVPLEEVGYNVTKWMQVLGPKEQGSLPKRLQDHK